MSAPAPALGSKPDAETSKLLLPAGLLLLVLTFLPFVYIIPYYINMILQVRPRRAARTCSVSSVVRVCTFGFRPA